MKKRVESFMAHMAVSAYVYLATVLGIMYAQVFFLLKEGNEITWPLLLAQVAPALLIGVRVTTVSEKKGDPIGRAKNIVNRIARGFNRGVTYNTVTGGLLFVGEHAFRLIGGSK